MSHHTSRRRGFIALGCVAAAVAAFVAVTYFRVPVRSLFFYAMIAACPLMHILMGHGGHAHGARDEHAGHRHGADGPPSAEKASLGAPAPAEIPSPAADGETLP